MEEDVLTRRPRRRFGTGAALLLVVTNLIVGLIGGAAGFVLLANSESPAIATLRDKLGINTEDGLAVPVRENLTLQENSAIIDAAKKIAPSTVSISASQRVTDFFGNVSDREVSGGTGFILTSDGLIITNKHVVSTPAQYKAVLNDGRIFDATVKAVDPHNDLAFVKIEVNNLQPVELGSSDALQIGQSVIAVGNALGEFRNSVTFGVVSAKQRSIEAATTSSSNRAELLSGLIQTDAAINPGNSGGPLVNMAGQVVGINTAIASTTGGSIGVGFAIPIDSVKGAIDSVRKNGEIIRPYLGVRYVPVTKSLQQLNKLSVDYGALVSGGSGQPAIVSGSPAEKAGIQEGDIILEVNGERINEDHTLTDRLLKYQVGDSVALKILRGGKEVDVRATLERL